MLIQIQKLTQYKCAYKITRTDNSLEKIVLETKVYLVHDICHYVVEKHLGFEGGFWGMLSKGYQFKQLFGKENQLTKELRFVEQVVGPVQSVYMGYFKKEDFGMLIQHIDFSMTENQLNTCLTEIKAITNEWKKLAIGEILNLNWNG